MVHIKLKDSTNLNGTNIGQLLKIMAIEANTRSQQRRKELDNKVKEQVEFLNKCRNLAQSVMPGPVEVDTNKSLERAY